MVALKQETIQDLARIAVKKALNQGANESEAFVSQSSGSSIGIERAQISRSTRAIDQGIGIRVIVNKAIGFSYTNVIEDKSAIDDIARRAIVAAKASKSDSDWHGLPEIKSYTALEGTFDSKIADLQCEDLVSIAEEMLQAAESTDKRVFAIEGGAGSAEISVAIANSNGVDASDRGTVIDCSLATVGQEGDIVTPICFEFNSERSFNINPTWVGKEAARLALSALKPQRVETKEYRVIFTQTAMQQLLYYTLVVSIKADSVQRGRSALKGKLGEKIASDIITVYDDGLLKNGLRTWKFDGEAVPQQKTSVIEKGVLRDFISDTYSARKEGKESTGNATRSGYLSTPWVEATNFHFLSGNKTSTELIEETNEGLIVSFLQGAHSSNSASGEFSVVATPAWKIKNGEIKHATRGIMLAGNIFTLLKNISIMGNNERKLGQLVAPWMLVENVKVIGK